MIATDFHHHMVPIKPYLVRAAYQWALDNGQTPHLLVDATVAGVQAPTEYIEDGRIVFNIDSHAASDLLMTDDLIEFKARFSGKPFTVIIPINAVLGLYAREGGEGISFSTAGSEEESKSKSVKLNSPRGKPDLKIIK